MDQVINFLLENYRLIADVIAVIVALVFFLVKKKPIKVVDSVKTVILSLLPDYVNQAEEKFGARQGEEKFKYVLMKVMLDLKRTQPGVDCSLYLDVIKEGIENILSTPQKKGE